MSEEVTEHRINNTSNQDTEKLFVHVCYGLYAIGLFVLDTSVIAVVINYIKKNGSPEIRPHHTWMINTFWVSLVLFLLGMVLDVIPIVNFVAIPILTVAFVWYVYRIAKGWIFFLENKAI